MKTMSKTPDKMPDNVTDRPLVTFALFAYNQEGFIREAVEGAFAQTYEPLEIILSDDCSSDRTFEIMEEMAAAYEGPHVVHCRQNPRNIGVLSHVLSVMHEIGGSLVVVAAGDDISLPHRSAELTRVWKETGGWGFFSSFDSIDSDGLTIAENVFSRGNGEIMNWFAPLGSSSFLHGATSAYDARLFEFIPRVDNRTMAEDGLFFGLLKLLDRQIICVPLPLVAYRQHSGAIANNTVNFAPSFNVIRDQELKIRDFAATYVQIADLLESIAENNPEMQVRFEQVQDGIREASKRFAVRRDWVEMSVFAKLRLAISSEKPEIRTFIASRIFGLYAFCFIKSLYCRTHSLLFR